MEGDENNHFHLGITSKQLLKNVYNASTFHFDCTYRIVKYGFPVIVFRFTDLRRKFFPICYFVTSHEQEIDFNFFWTSLFKIANSLDINLVEIIDYICIDSCYASANSIEKNLIKSTIIMCWYHLKAKVI